eukprot:TRINITY_DN2045_c1_g1_i1.p1 TRINITY_DN2045_c1_g1~~TRINITY_DN2045_c1_g1_i1.p1  ORF type:complete len:751 (+),score=202.36 TRINITY_DN2045_c1_g1_i1:70-2322(+)
MGNSLANHNYEIVDEEKHLPYNSQFCDFFQGRKLRINGEVESLHKNVGIFAYQIDPETMSPNKLQLISNGIMRLRTLRHPHILHVIESFEIKNGVKGKSFIITEKAVPISRIINQLSTTHLKLGIYQILTSIHFLHSFCKLSHNNLTSDAIFVRTNSYNTYDFKLAAMEYTTSLEKSASLLASANNNEDGNAEGEEGNEKGAKVLDVSVEENKEPSTSNPEESNTQGTEGTNDQPQTEVITENNDTDGGNDIPLSPLNEQKNVNKEEELTNIELKSAENRYIHYRDVLALGNMLPGLFKDKIDKKHPFYDLLQDLIEKLKDKKEVENLTVDKILEHGFFRENIVISVVEFLKYLSAKGREQKEEFFKGLKDSVAHMSIKDTIDIVLPHILCVETLREPSVHHFLSHLFTPKDKDHADGVFEKDLFESLIMSWICRSFAEQNIVIRIVLLKQIANFLKFIKADELENVIWPLIWNSTNEQNDELIINTLHSFVSLLSFWKSQKSETLLPKIQMIVPYVSRLAEVDMSLKVRVSAIRILPRIWQTCPADINHSGYFIHFFDTFRRNFHSDEPIVRKTTLESVVDSKECFSYHNNVVHILPHCLHLLVDRNRAVRDQCHTTILTISKYIQSQPFQPLREELMPLKPWDLLDPFRRQFSKFVDGHLLLSNEDKPEDLSLQSEEYVPVPRTTSSSNLLLKEENNNNATENVLPESVVLINNQNNGKSSPKTPTTPQLSTPQLNDKDMSTSANLLT